MKKHYLGLTLAILFVANPIFAQDSNPIKWGISLGAGSTEYETIIIVDEDDGNQRLRTDEVDFSSMLIGFDARSGKHHFGLAGVNPQGKFWIKLAEPYPLLFASFLAKVYVKHFARRTADGLWKCARNNA